MNNTAETYHATLEGICSGTIANAAAAVDRDAAFPSESMAALAAAGLLNLESLGLPGAATVVERIAEECGSTAMVATMHYCGAAVLNAYAPEAVRREAASGKHVSTLAFSESGSRSHFWAPVSTAKESGDAVVLDARKSWVTSASYATAYVWSSRPVSTEGLSTIWLVDAKAPGINVEGRFEGLGLRGNDSCAVSADGVRVERSAMLGADGQGFEIMMQVVLPTFAVLNAACSVGLMRGALRRTVAHVTATRHADTGSALADLPTIRGYVARMQTKADMAAALLADTVSALGAQRADATLRVLESKAAAGETANEVLDLAMRVCGGAAFRREGGVDRFFRDARAAGVMAPTTDVLYDFIGKAVCGLPLF